MNKKFLLSLEHDIKKVKKTFCAKIRNGILVVDVYDENGYRITSFLSHKDFINYSYEHDEWSGKSIGSELYFRRQPDSWKATKKSHAEIEKFAGKLGIEWEAGTSFYEKLSDLQYKFREKKREKAREYRRKKKEEELEETRMLMRVIGERPLPKDKDDKIHHSFTQYMVYRKNKGYCTNCKSYVTNIKARHNAVLKCPSCGRNVISKAAGYKKGNVYDRSTYICAAKISINGEVLPVLRYFANYQYFNCKGTDTDFHSMEVIRTVIYRNRLVNYEKRQGQWKKCRFKMDCYGNRYYGIQCSLATNRYEDKRSIANAIRTTHLRYSCTKEIVEYVRKTSRINSVYDYENYIELYVNFPVTEILYKTGNMDILQKIKWRDMDKKGKSPAQMLKIERRYLRYFTDGENPVTYYDLLYYQNLTKVEEKEGYRFNEKELQYFSEIDNKLALKIAQSGILKNVGVIKIDNYIKKLMFYNIDECASIMYNDNLNDWLDYISALKDDGRDITNEFVIFPPVNRFRQMHDEITNRIDVAENNEAIEKIDEMLPALQEAFTFRKDGFLITPPLKTAKEIIMEGEILHHCVGRYVKKVLEGRCMILFVRKESYANNPYYTMEINPELSIEQCRGHKNCAMTPEVEKITNEYIDFIRKKGCIIKSIA